MTPDERSKTCQDIAGICARGYDLHVEAHGPDGTAAVRTGNGRAYEVAPVPLGGAVSFIDRGGERFAVSVFPLDTPSPVTSQCECSGLARHHPRCRWRQGYGSVVLNPEEASHEYHG